MGMMIISLLFLSILTSIYNLLLSFLSLTRAGSAAASYQELELIIISYLLLRRLKLRILILSSILILVAITTRSQEAKVILLSSYDATHAESTYKALQKAQADWEVEKARLTEKYLVVGYGDPEAGQEVSGLLIGNVIGTMN